VTEIFYTNTNSANTRS